MPGDDWQGFANLRALLAYQWLFPGKQLLFMGGEFGQKSEWNENAELSWWLLDEGPYHVGTQRFVQDLNQLYRKHAALWEGDHDPHGFQWIDCGDQENSVLSFARRPLSAASEFVVALNLTPVPRYGYRIGLPRSGRWLEVLNSDAHIYGGSGVGNLGGVTAEDYRIHGQPFSAPLTLPPIGVVVFQSES
jgi:1,4-alpha-glucan branching enzyme